MTKAEQVYTTYIRTTPEKLWAAITNPEFTSQYWGGRTVSDWKKGSKWQLMKNDENTPKITGSVLESNPPKKLVVSWTHPDDEGAEAEHSRVTYKIEAEDDMVRLDVTHSNLEPGSDMHTGISNGWPRMLSSLKTFLETGKGLNVWTVSCSAPKVTAAG